MDHLHPQVAEMVKALEAMPNPYMPEVPNTPKGWIYPGFFSARTADVLTGKEMKKLEKKILKARTKWINQKLELIEREKRIVTELQLFRFERTNADFTESALESLADDYENQLRQYFRDQDREQEDRKAHQKAAKQEKKRAKEAAKAGGDAASSYIGRLCQFNSEILDKLAFTQPEQQEELEEIPIVNGNHYLKAVREKPDAFGSTGPDSGRWSRNLARSGYTLRFSEGEGSH